MNNKFAIPGLGLPGEAKKEKQRKFTSPDGSLAVEIYREFDLDTPRPNFEIYISRETDREVYLYLSDVVQKYVIKQVPMDGGYIKYLLYIPNTDLSLIRGTYFLRVIVNGTENVYTITVRNHPLYANRLDYEWIYG